MGKTPAGKAFRLTESDISSSRCLTRRSLLGALGLGLGTAAAAVVGARRGAAQAPTGCSDDDIGPNEDAEGFGTSCRPGRPTGCTDNDGGRNGDMPGFGTNCSPRSTRPAGCTDSDNGPNGDQPGFGTRCWI